MAIIKDTTSEKQPPAARAAEQSFVQKVLGFFKSPQLWLSLLGMVLVGGLLFFLLTLWMTSYTKHGQRLEVGEYVGLKLADASTDIERASFRTEVIDSVFLVDKPPHEVLRQDPEPGSYVKADRRIYLTVTKAIPDEVTLPALAGTYDFDRYRRKLNMLDIEGRVRDRTFSNKYQENTILKVYYDDKELSEERLRSGVRIPKGSVLEFTVTSKAGGEVAVPELVCRTFEEASFTLNSYKLRQGKVVEDASVSDRDLAYVWKQDPAYVPGESLPFDTEVVLYLTAQLPSACNDL